MAIYHTPKLKDMALSERPQERLASVGASALSDTELLAMLLRSGSARLDVLGLANTLLSRAGSLGKLLQWGEMEFRNIHGIGRVKALQLLAVMELAKRILAQRNPAEPFMDSAAAVYQYLQASFVGIRVEQFWALCLNRKNRLIKAVVVSSGTATASLVHPREVFQEAIRVNATAIIVAHNHPSGDPLPSQADRQATRILKKASEVVDIALLDHLVIGDPKADPSGRGYYSFAESGLL